MSLLNNDVLIRSYFYANLTRLDLVYSFLLKSLDSIAVTEFFIKTQRKVLEISLTVRFESNQEGVLLKVRHRKHVNFVRIYKKKGE